MSGLGSFLPYVISFHLLSSSYFQQSPPNLPNHKTDLPPQTLIRVLHQCGSCPKTCAKILIPISSTGSTNGVAFWSANHTDVFSTNEARLE
ncbi:unnamed protein product [Nesidiocoris tenuis]|uniref:Uncharacterized protein n=1 Tax=Nesidiocoris tenuis TaxID=355587 RepID=A0A6H5FV52_9HEMI|nr:unnamed protein product [Nesidiocoris tenuis]